LKEKRIMPLVSHLIGTVLLHEPDDPVAFVVRLAEDMANFRDKRRDRPPIVFDDDHLANIFESIDILNSGSIDLKQYSDGKSARQLKNRSLNA